MISTYYVGQRFGEYQLLRLLGRGGFTEVHLGEHTQTGTLAAIKLLVGHLEPNDLEKFLARSEVLSHLRHPHIVEVFASGVEHGTAYLAMSYAANGTMRERYPKGTRLPLDVVVSYVKQAANALQYVHMHTLIHRDIKPHNMLLDANNSILLSDFGIAVVSPSQDPSQPNFYDFEGTVLYAAPEQLQGQPRRSSDQYSLGVVVYEWLTGTWPFTGRFEEVVHKHLFEEPPSLIEKGVEVPSAVEAVVMRALEKDPEQRFPSIEDFALALEMASQHEQAILTESALRAMAQPRRQFKSPLPFPWEEV